MKRSPGRRAARRRARCSRGSGASAATASLGGRREHVADAADRMDQRAAEFAVNLVAKRVDVDFDDVADALEVNVPDMFDDQRAGHRTSAVAHQELEEG